MAGIILPNRFARQQPQYPARLDLQGLAKGAQFCINPAVGPTDLVTKRTWTPNGNFGIVATPAGRTLNYDGSGSYLSYTGYPEISGAVGTIAVWFSRVGVSAPIGHMLFGDASIYSGVTSGGQIYAWASASTGNIASWFNSVNRSLILTSDGTAGGIKVYLDGVDSGVTFTNPPGAFSSSSKSLAIGTYAGGGGNWYVDGSQISAVYLSTTWGATEAKAFTESRGNALYKIPSRKIWVGVAAAGGTAYTQSLSGSITATGAITKQTGKPLAGSSTAAGVVSKLTAKYPAGSITPTGSIGKAIAHGLAGSITGTGTVLKRTTKSFAGSISGTGAVSTMILFTASVAGSITATGAIAKMTLKALTGSSTFSGAIAKMTSKGLSASITLAGALNKLTTKAFAGSVTVTGAILESYQVVKSLAGSIKPTGTVAAVYIAFVAGVLKLLSLMGVGQ